MRKKEESEEIIEYPYDNVVGELYPYMEPLEKLVYIVKKAAVLAGIVAACLYVMMAGEEDPPPEPKKILNISVIDEFPAESEPELRVLGEDYRKTEDGESNSSPQFDWANDWIYLRQEDGSAEEKRGSVIQMDTVQFFVMKEDIRSGGKLNAEELCYAVRLYGVGEKTILDSFCEGRDICEEFNSGISTVRRLVSEGYLDEQVTYLIDLYPKINPHEREYTLRLVDAGETLMESTQDRSWHVEYGLYTEADTGEEFQIASVYIARDILKQGEPQDNPAMYRIDLLMESIWQLMEDPARDMGDVRLQKIEGDSFADEESVRRFVEEQGAAFLLPEGVDVTINWNCYRQEEFYYDYLVWRGETADYEIMLAIPLMEKQNEGYYMSSVIRKEAEDKASCHHILSGMMQTFRSNEYLHIVKEGESLCKIAEKYKGDQSLYSLLLFYNEADDRPEPFENPNLIYPGQKVYVPLTVQPQTPGIVNAKYLEVRAEPDISARLVARLPIGEKVTILAEENGYYRISLENREGYVEKEYIDVEYHSP